MIVKKNLVMFGVVEMFVNVLIDKIEFYAVSAIFQPSMI